MAPKKMETGVTCTVGGRKPTGVVELLGPAVMVYITPETKVEPGTEFQIGAKVLADFRRERQSFGEDNGFLAVRVRRYGPDQKDIDNLVSLLQRVERAGFGDLGFGDPAAYLEKVFAQRLTQGKTGPLGQALEQDVVGRLSQSFPDTWAHEIEPVVDEMEEKLRAIGVATPLAREPIQEVFNRHADQADDMVLYRHFVAATCQQANIVLSAAGKRLQWHQFEDLPWAEEPFWLLTTVEQRDALLRERILKAPSATPVD